MRVAGGNRGTPGGFAEGVPGAVAIRRGRGTRGGLRLRAPPGGQSAASAISGTCGAAAGASIPASLGSGAISTCCRTGRKPERM